ncbi:MAG: hypothetical protein LBU87_06415 [Lactobacillales bacterium]|jgi:hypothetical protein|nr:hypothetical protein [Lactobacillales bacterium]
MAVDTKNINRITTYLLIALSFLFITHISFAAENTMKCPEDQIKNNECRYFEGIGAVPNPDFIVWYDKLIKNHPNEKKKSKSLSDYNNAAFDCFGNKTLVDRLAPAWKNSEFVNKYKKNCGMVGALNEPAKVIVIRNDARIIEEIYDPRSGMIQYVHHNAVKVRDQIMYRPEFVVTCNKPVDYDGNGYAPPDNLRGCTIGR